jgi:putative acetyltransferase
VTEVTIRREQPGDEAAIRDMVRRAFIGRPYADGDEQDVIDRLRADGDLLLSLVAEQDSAIIGQITFSPAILVNGDEGWVVLGPVAIAPAHQGKGLGRALMEAGEAIMRAEGKAGVTVLGNPAIYGRFGFAQNTPMWLAGELGWAFQVKSFCGTIPDTEQRYVRAFEPTRS